eukprot:293040_1
MKIYVSMKKWETNEYQIKKQNHFEDEAKYKEKLKRFDEQKYDVIPSVSINEEDMKEMKYPEDDMEDNESVVRTFCAITNADDNTAVAFLAATNWIIPTAIDRYYAFSGDITKLVPSSIDINEIYNNNVDCNESSINTVYHHGIYFWYWNELKPKKFKQKIYYYYYTTKFKKKEKRRVG